MGKLSVISITVMGESEDECELAHPIHLLRNFPITNTPITSDQPNHCISIIPEVVPLVKGILSILQTVGAICVMVV